MCNNPNLDLININAYTKFGKILSIWTERLTTQIQYSNIAPTFSKGGYNNSNNKKETHTLLGWYIEVFANKISERDKAH